MTSYLRFLLVFFMLALLIGTTLDFTTSFIGMLGIFGASQLDSFNVNNLFIYFISFMASFLILMLSIFAYYIWSDDLDSSTVRIFNVLKPLHLSAIAYDAFTSYFGAAQLVIFNRMSMENNPDMSLSFIWDSSTTEQKILILFVTVLVTISPILFSRFYSIWNDI